LPNLPIDMFLEIAAYLAPADLLHLLQVSKSLRTTLASPECRVAWLRTLRSVPDLPPCPSDMCVIFYTALVFGHNCFVGVSSRPASAYSVDYALRVRYCATCYEEK
ncbi:hypothetical protein C8T65DRAFT_586422, partial [Cerioporus squamosus]